MIVKTDKSDTIRMATISDASVLQEIYAPYVCDTAISFETEAPSVQEMEERIQQTMAVYPWLVFEQDGAINGYAYACQHRTRTAYRWSVDVGIYVRRGYAGQGIGHKLYKPLLKQLLELGYANAFAGITLPNPASVALHEAFGFVQLGVYREVGFKLGKWHDVGWWQLSMKHDEEPGEPVRLSTLVDR